MASKESVVFIGSGPVAAQCLELLVKNFAVETVITKPRPAHHRGAVPVLELADKLSLPVITTANKAELDDAIQSRTFQSKLAVLIDFGIIVSQAVIDAFPLGILNSHFSILPDLRGADPITFAILSGQKQTGVSLMFLVEAMDEGPLLSFGEYELSPKITTPKLTRDLIELSDTLLAHNIPRIFAKQLKGAPQSVTGRSVSYSRKLSKSDANLDWTKSALQLEREIRAFIGWPGSRTMLGGKDIIITQAHVARDSLKPGEVQATKTELHVGTSKGCLAIDKLKPAGKSEMTTTDFLSGYGNTL